MEDKRDTDSRRSLSSNTSRSYHRLSPASTMLFTAKFTALVFAVVAATFCQVTAKPAPVDASSNSKDALTHGVDTIDANITHVDHPIDSAAPASPAATAYPFEYSTFFYGGTTCSDSPSDVGTVNVLNDDDCTQINPVGDKTVQCIRRKGSTTSVDLSRILVCQDTNCARDCIRLSDATARSNHFYSTRNARSILVIPA
ncbi:hypothetical protein OH76DRAFT_326401 [Lentinus brumalis]|uniref:Uncharacterized protein n=1 Tax=Lentinus brumalis TaxID=2498619 RepID=A0A371DFL3_9APHY|nr:hypothetical protein OH76DRAFT_326401 [Polyporus brumalis]